MPVRAGFADIDITPPIGTRKIGWIKEIISTEVADPLFARVAVFESGENRAAFVQLDTLLVSAVQTADIRQRIEKTHRFPGRAIMVSATHNHAGPAVEGGVDFPRDEAYVETLTTKIVQAFGEALAGMQNAEIGASSVFEWRISHNRRVVMRDGTVKTHGAFADPNALCLEGPIDPEVGVLAARGGDGQLLGLLVNFSCHPTHHGGDTVLSGGYPGVLARTMKSRGCPVALFFNGAAGNLHTSDPAAGGADMGMEAAGMALAEDASAALAKMSFSGDIRVASVSRLISLPYRTPTDAEIHGTIRGAQRFIDPAIYDRGMARLVEMIRKQGAQPAEVQVISVGPYTYAGVPAEYFVQHGLRIKEESYPRHALVISCTNGMVGYVPHTDAFRRGGYETTFSYGSKLAPEAGDMLADAAIDLIRDR